MSLDAPKPDNPSSDGLSIGIVCARYNEELTDALLARVSEVIQGQGEPENLSVERVPGSHEIPVGLSLMLESRDFDCLVGLGVVLKGATSHHHLVAESAGSALQKLAIDQSTPIINGIIVTETLEEARERVTGSIDRGREFAEAALSMAQLKRRWKKS